MGRDQKGDPRLGRLPREPINRVTGPLARFLRVETAGGAILLLAVAGALALANSASAHGFLGLLNTPPGVRAGSSSSSAPFGTGSTAA